MSSPIRVNDSTLAECVVTPVESLNKSQEFMIKALCMLILMVVNNKGSKNKYSSFLSVIRTAVNEAERIYCENDDNQPNPFDTFS